MRNGLSALGLQLLLYICIILNSCSDNSSASLNDPKAPGLKHKQYADAQGLNRLDRTQHFYNIASELAVTNNIQFQWEFYINERADHNYEVASQDAADLIFN